MTPVIRPRGTIPQATLGDDKYLAVQPPRDEASVGRQGYFAPVGIMFKIAGIPCGPIKRLSIRQFPILLVSSIDGDCGGSS